jgi:hypothetical protein
MDANPEKFSGARSTTEHTEYTEIGVNEFRAEPNDAVTGGAQSVDFLMSSKSFILCVLRFLWLPLDCVFSVVGDRITD